MLVRRTWAVAALACATAVTVPGVAQAATQSGTQVVISSRRGWQDTGVHVFAGDRVRVRQVGGSWTVDSGTFPWVDAAGYDRGTDAHIFQGCKVRADATYGRLLSKVSGGTRRLGPRWSWYAPRSGRLFLRINDQQRCLGDNAGALIIRIWH
ncbi:hypothetical protein [Nonomuraea rhizosphaerae]|uniref:hypothetical protein n=1 Tax=Nonomuraea rhizosphaerae TaxID=2665663 RepID=UPI001C5CD025|nr:hypothetical protein [Nonomuraea rhizosphaerae]